MTDDDMRVAFPFYVLYNDTPSHRKDAFDELCCVGP